MIERIILASVLSGDRPDIAGMVDSGYFVTQDYKKIASSVVRNARSGDVLHDVMVDLMGRDDLLSRVKELSLEAVILPEDWERELEENFYQHHLRRLAKKITDPGLPFSVKMAAFNEIKRAFDSSVNSEVIRLVDSVREYAADLRKGMVDDYSRKKIDITDDNLRTIFGAYLRPAPYTIGGVPGGFKTSLLMNLMVHLCAKGKRGLYFSFEDHGATVKSKFLAVKMSISKALLYDYKIIPEAIDYLKDEELGIYIYDRFMTVPEFQQKCDMHMSREPLDFIALDYLQLFKSQSDKMLETMSAATAAIKAISNTYAIPVIALSQLNKDGGAKWSQTIWEETRFFAKLMPHTDEARVLDIKKNTWGPEKKFEIRFHGESGEIRSVYEYKAKKDDKSGEGKSSPQSKKAK